MIGRYETTRAMLDILRFEFDVSEEEAENLITSEDIDWCMEEMDSAFAKVMEAIVKEHKDGR